MPTKMDNEREIRSNFAARGFIVDRLLVVGGFLFALVRRRLQEKQPWRVWRSEDGEHFSCLAYGSLECARAEFREITDLALAQAQMTTLSTQPN